MFTENMNPSHSSNRKNLNIKYTKNSWLMTVHLNFSNKNRLVFHRKYIHVNKFELSTVQKILNLSDQKRGIEETCVLKKSNLLSKYTHKIVYVELKYVWHKTRWLPIKQDQNTWTMKQSNMISNIKTKTSKQNNWH